MIFKLPFRGRIRKPRHSEISIRNKRIDALNEAKSIARKISEDTNVLELWILGNTDSILQICEEYNKDHEFAGFISSSMIFIELTHILKNK